MTGSDFIGQASFRIGVRPGRAAYLVAAGSVQGVKRAVQEACSRWGGGTEPIIPVRKSGVIDPIWKRVVALSGVEGAVNVDVEAAVADAAANNLGLPLTDLQFIDDSGITRFSPHPASVRAEGSSAEVHLLAGEARELWEVVAAGDLTEERVAELNGSDFVLRRAATRDEIGRQQLRGMTLVHRTLSQFAERSAHGWTGPYPSVVWVTKPNGLRDCLLFWNLRALRPLRFEDTPMLLLPHGGTESWVDFDQSVGGWLGRSEEITPDVVIATAAVSDQQVRSVAASLGLQETTADYSSKRRFFKPIAPRTPPFTYRTDLDVRSFVSFDRTYGTVAEVTAQLFRNGTRIEVESPVHFVHTCRFLVDVSGTPFDNIPRRSETALLVSPDAVWSDDRLQLAISGGKKISLQLRLPSLEDAARATLDAAVLDWSLSDKGQIAQRLRDKTSDRHLLEGESQRLLAKLTTPRSKGFTRELTRMRENGHPDLDLAEIASEWGGRAERRHLSVAQLVGSANSDTVRLLERLTSAGWIERGFQIRCELCGLKSFVPLAETAAQPACPACGAPEQYVTNGGGPEVRYRLNAIVDRASDQGVMSHLAADFVLQNSDRPGFLFLGVDVRLADGSRHEVDLFGVHGGLVVAGEAKSSPQEFDSAQLRRDVGLSKALGADAHLLVCSRAIEQQKVVEAWELCQQNEIQLAVVEQDTVRWID